MGEGVDERADDTSRAFLFLPHREVPPPAPPRDRVSEILDALDDTDL